MKADSEMSAPAAPRPWLALFLITAFALAWPWEVFQRLPLPGATIVKLAGAALIGLAAVLLLLRHRDWRNLHTGLELPILLFALACCQSLFHSLDPWASARLLAQYVLYLLLFYAIVATLRRREDAVLIAWCFVASAAAMAVVAVLCSAGMLYPTLVDGTRHLAARLTDEMREGPTVRIAATALDFNQAVLPLLAALPLCIFLSLALPRAWRLLAVPLVILMIAGIAVSFSRSTLAAAAVVILLALSVGLRRRLGGRWILAAYAAGLVILIVGGYAWWEPLAQRLSRGIGSYDPSYSSRWYVAQQAWEILPRYWMFGAGLNASDAAIAEVADPMAWRGITLHSVPFKILLETGVLGLAAWAWLYAALCWRVWRGYAGDPPLRYAWIGVFIAILLVQAVQPFMALSLYPLLLGLALGPVAGRRTATDGPPEKPRRFARATATAAALLLCAVVIAANAVAYQRTAARAFAVTDMLDHALTHELDGEWAQAEALYATVELTSAENDRYFGIAAVVAELPVVLKGMYLPEDTPPTAAATLGRGRVAYAQGNFRKAAEYFDQVPGKAAETLKYFLKSNGTPPGGA